MNEFKYIFGAPLEVNGITFRHPKVADIIDIGEEFYLSAVNLFIVKMSNLMVELYECDLDYRKVNPYDIFISLCSDTLLRKDGQLVPDKRGLPKWDENSETSKKLGWLTGIDDFRISTDGKVFFLYSPSTNKVIDEAVYKLVRRYYSILHCVSFDEKYNPGNDQTLKFLVKQEKRQRQLEAKRNHKDDLANKVSCLVWSTGITFDEAKNLYVYQFFEGLSRISKIREYEHICTGYYSGNIKNSDFSRAVEKVDWTQ